MIALNTVIEIQHVNIGNRGGGAVIVRTGKALTEQEKEGIRNELFFNIATLPLIFAPIMESQSPMTQWKEKE